MDALTEPLGEGERDGERDAALVRDDCTEADTQLVDVTDDVIEILERGDSVTTDAVASADADERKLGEAVPVVLAVIAMDAVEARLPVLSKEGLGTTDEDGVVTSEPVL